MPRPWQGAALRFCRSAHVGGVNAVLDPRRPIALAGQLIERDNGGGMRRHSAQFSAAITTDPKPISCASWPAACFCSSLSLAINGRAATTSPVSYTHLTLPTNREV